MALQKPMSAFDIAKWLDNRNCKLKDCYEGNTHGGYAGRTAQEKKDSFLVDLKSYAKKIKQSKLIELNNRRENIGWNAINISRCLRGFAGVPADCTEVQAVLAALANKIKNSSDNLDAQAIGNALYGLQSMNAESDAVKQVLEALANKIKNSSDNLSAQNMNAESDAVKHVLEALANKIKNSSDNLDAQAIGNALYGLQNMNIQNPSVRNILKEIEKKFPDNFCKNITNEISLLEWGQTVIGYLGLAKHSTLTVSQVQRLFPKIQWTSEVIDYKTVKEQFILALKALHLKNDILDLHSLDHASAKLLLEETISSTSSKLVKKIICGAGRHSKHPDNKMHSLLQNHLQDHHIAGTWQKDGGNFTVSDSSNAQWSLSSTQKKDPQASSSTQTTPSSTQPKKRY